ncbi:hypothetical protein [Novosphingobium sp. KA1]|uniref:hypothetical protein n=1 Tax=Novosphingobium sp. (strain KA1) TaxID=164608 RepID=UPI001A8F6282|nr:hypothetical protein [Novosphingobium sp. KA1]
MSDADNVSTKSSETKPRSNTTKRKTKSEDSPALPKSPSSRNKRPTRPFPAGPFEDALKFAEQLYNFSSGQSVRRLSLFNELGKAPDSSASRMLITNSNKYGLAKGGYQSDFIEPTEACRQYFSETTSNRERSKIKTDLAINKIECFKFIFDKYSNNKLPARAAIIDTAKEALICPLLSGPSTIVVLTTKEEWNGSEAQAGGDHRQAA